MPTSFAGWLASWYDSWGAGLDPNAVSGSANITISATGTIYGVYTPIDGEYFGGGSVRKMPKIKKKRENDEALLLFIL